MKSHIPQQLRYWVSVILPIALGLAFVLSTGPQVQSYFFSLLNSDIPSVYGSAYQESVVRFPSLGTWVGAGLEWHFLLMALSITVFAVRRPEPRLIVWRAALASLLILCIFDFGFGLLNNQLTSKGMAENAVGNLIGGILIAAILVAMLSVADFLYAHAPVGLTGKRAVAAGTSLLSGLFCCCLAYYLSDLFYNPLPVKFEAYFSAPAHGAAVPERASPSSRPKERDELQPFSFAPAKSIVGDATWTSGREPLKVQMLTGNNGQKYQVSLALLSGCLTRNQVKGLNTDTPWLVLNDVDVLEVSFDPGITNFFTMIDDVQTSRFKVDVGFVGQFNINQDAQSKRLEVTQFVGKDASLEFHNGADEQSFVLSAPAMGMIGDRVSLSSRILTLKIGTQTFLLKFDPPRNASRSDKVVCSVQQVPRPTTTELNLKSVESVNLIAGVLVKVSRKKEASLMGIEDLGFRVSGDGWLGLVGLRPEQLERQPLGTLGMLQVQGNVTDLVIDGSPLTVRSLDTYTVIGDLKVAYGDQGRLRVTGRPTRLWKDRSRMNLTKWEKLGWEAKVFVLGLLGSAAAFLSPLLARRLRTNNRFTWVS